MKQEHIKSYYTINGLCLFIVCVTLTSDLPLVRDICTLAAGDTLVNTDTVSMYIKIDDRRFDVNFSVFETLSKPVIIGTPFLKRHKAVISFDTLVVLTLYVFWIKHKRHKTLNLVIMDLHVSRSS